MHILPIRFPKPNKPLWRTPQGRCRRGFRPLGSISSIGRGEPSRAKSVREIAYCLWDEATPGGRIDQERNPVSGDAELWNPWISGGITVTRKRWVGIVQECRGTDRGTAWSRAPATKTVQSGGLLGQVVGRMLVQRAQQERCGRRSRHCFVEDNRVGSHILAVEPLVAVVVRTQSGTRQ
jgi:hypothetical protein